MQNYKEDSNSQCPGKKIVLEFLDYLAFKVRNDSLTLGEASSLAKALMENVTLTGTIDELAGYFGQTKGNVKVVINRKYPGKPRRKVFYSFNVFRKIVPSGWLESNKNDGDK